MYKSHRKSDRSYLSPLSSKNIWTDLRVRRQFHPALGAIRPVATFLANRPFASLGTFYRTRWRPRRFASHPAALGFWPCLLDRSLGWSTIVCSLKFFATFFEVFNFMNFELESSNLWPGRSRPMYPAGLDEYQCRSAGDPLQTNLSQSFKK